jgi:hypothetical protein
LTLTFPRIILAFALSTSLGCSGPATGNAQKNAAPTASPQKASAPDTQTWKLKRVEQSAPLTDWRTGQTRTYRMMNMLLPDAWTMEPRPGPDFGKIDCADNSSRFLLSAISADKSTGILVVPAQATLWSTNQAYLQQRAAFARQWKSSACTIEQPKALSAALLEAAPKLVPGAQIVGQMQPVPDLSDQMPQIVAGANQKLAASNSHITADAGRLRLTGSLQGRQAEMWLIAMQTVRTDPAPGGGQVMITDYPLLALVFAPPGQLDRNDKLLSAVLASVQVDPEWTDQGQGYVAAVLAKIQGAQQEVARIHANMALDNANAARQQQAIRNGAAQNRSQVIANVAHDRSAALDHSSQQFALYMGDQAIYKDPSSGQQVQMSSGYNHVWASSSGSTNQYILTDSPSYNPNGNAGSAGWTQMEMEH